MNIKATPRAYVLVLLAAVCVFVWGRNFRLMQGGAQATRSSETVLAVAPPSDRLPESDDFKLGRRDPFASPEPRLAPHAAEQRQPRPEPRKPVLLPYQLVGIVGSLAKGNATALVRDDQTGDVIMVAIRDSLMGFGLEHLSSDTLFLSGLEGKALVLAHRSP